MKRMIGRLLALILAVSWCLSAAGSALASTKASFYLTNYSVSLSALNGEDIEISLNVVANQSANEIGATYILLEKSSDGGRTWSTAEEYENESWMTALNRQMYLGSTIYHGIAGCRYRATATVFAYNSPSEQDSRTVGPCDWVTARN